MLPDKDFPDRLRHTDNRFAHLDGHNRFRSHIHSHSYMYYWARHCRPAERNWDSDRYWRSGFHRRVRSDNRQNSGNQQDSGNQPLALIHIGAITDIGILITASVLSGRILIYVIIAASGILKALSVPAFP